MTCKKRSNIYRGFRDVFPQIEIRQKLIAAYYYTLEMNN